MKRHTLLASGVAVCLLGSPAFGQSLKLGSAAGAPGDQVEIPLSLSTDVEVQAVLAVFDWEGAAGSGVELNVDPEIAAAANFVNVHVDADWMTVGITSVTAPLSGADLHLATAVIQCADARATDTPITFRDAVHSAPGSPLLLSNTVTVDGSSVRKEDGLELKDGSFRCTGPAKTYRLALGSDEGGLGDEVQIPLRLSTDAAVQAVLAVFDWDGSAGSGVELNVDPGLAAAADFVNVHVDADWMAVGITIVTAPLSGDDLHLATAVIRCGPTPLPTDTPIVFRDAVHSVPGSPLVLSNTVTVDSSSVRKEHGLELESGSFRCTGEAEICDDLIDNDDDGLVDGADPDCVQGFRRGDANVDGKTDIADPIFLLNFLFGGGQETTCREGTDTNDDARVDIADTIFLLNYLFGGGPVPPSPGPKDCGPDSTAPPLGCHVYESC